MSVFIQVVINGILLGSMYGIAAAGLSLIFGTMRIIFLAQGTMIVFFAFVVVLALRQSRTSILIFACSSWCLSPSWWA